MRFDNRAWMIDILKDDHPHIVIPKSSKTGVSELMFLDVFAAAMRGLNGMYILPTEQVRNRLVASRIDMIIPQVPLYREKVSPDKKLVDSRSLKKIFGAVWNFVGSKSPESFYEFDADVMIYDEYDRCDPRNLTIAGDRTGAAAVEMDRIVGNPTVPGYGIWAKFEESDKRFWHVRCEHCGEWHILDWEKQFVRETDSGQWQLKDTKSTHDACPICTKCDKPFNRLGTGCWVREAPDKSPTLHGYHVSRLFGAPGNDIGERQIIREEFVRFKAAQGSQTALQIFFNNRLGVPYVNKDDKLTEGVLDRCRGDYNLPYNRLTGFTVAGVDQGAHFHVKISEVYDGVPQTRYIGKCYRWAEVEAILENFNCSCVVVDAQGGGYAETRDFVHRQAGKRKAYMCYFRPKDQVRGLYVANESDHVITTNRTEAADLMVQSFHNGRHVLPANYREICDGEVPKHLTTPSRLIDETGKPTWTKGEDHIFFASIYEMLAQLVSGLHNSTMKPQGSWRVG